MNRVFDDALALDRQEASDDQQVPEALDLGV